MAGPLTEICDRIADSEIHMPEIGEMAL